MNVVGSIKNFVSDNLLQVRGQRVNGNNEWLMEQYRLTQECRYLDRLYRNCCDDLYHYLLTQSDAQLAQDVCQRTWLKVIAKRQYYKSNGRFIGWLFAIARNLLIDELRRLNKWQLTEEVEVVQPEASPTISKPMGFDDALMQLPFAQREAFVLKQEGFDLQEIANITHADVEAVKSRLRYAKASLKKHFASPQHSISGGGHD